MRRLLATTSAAMMKKPRAIYCTHVPEAPAAPPGIPSTGWRVAITEEEEVILKVIRETKEHFGLRTVPRVAGGWVRDKLLDKFSHDLDIALDDMSGEDFANMINEYLKLKGEATKTVGVIKANPEQSKHLATATVRIHGLDVDFVNLRSEIYEADSRIPTITIGTPQQDAERRDFTVNAMYYNILTEQVEDLTGKGLRDLQNGILRTPLAAHVTFNDDPLRMLRGIRFAARYGFRLDEDLCQALAVDQNVYALANKVSNERCGIELDKSLKGERPKLALDLLVAHGLADAVFKVPEERYIDDRLEVPSRVDWLTGMRIVDAFAARLGNNASAHPDATAVYLAALLFPLGMSQIVVKKGKKEPVVRHIVANSVRLGNHVAERVQTIVSAAIGFTEFLVRRESEQDRVQIGRLLLDVKQSWEDGLILALAVLDAGRKYSKDEIDYLEKANARAEHITRQIKADWDHDKIWERLQKDPILDGKQLMALLNIKGVEVKKATDLVKDFALLHTQGPTETKEAYVGRAKEYIQQNWR